VLCLFVIFIEKKRPKLSAFQATLGVLYSEVGAISRCTMMEAISLPTRVSFTDRASCWTACPRESSRNSNDRQRSIEEKLLNLAAPICCNLCNLSVCFCDTECSTQVKIACAQRLLAGQRIVSDLPFSAKLRRNPFSKVTSISGGKSYLRKSGNILRRAVFFSYSFRS
jgi:hypothetical protein